MQVSLPQGTKHLPRLFGLVLALAAAWPGVAAADADGLDATQCTFDPGSDARESDSAFAETTGDTGGPDAYPLTPCGSGPGCTHCEKCENDTCVALLPVACTQDSDCGELKYCMNNPSTCFSSCFWVPGKCKQDTDCGSSCALCKSNSCVSLYTNQCGSGPCPSGYFCGFDNVNCIRKCMNYDGGTPPDAASGDAADTPDTAATDDTKTTSDTTTTSDAATTSDASTVSDTPDTAKTEMPTASDSPIAPLDAPADGAGAPVPPMAPADPGCSAGPSGGAAPWSLWLALAVLVLVRRKKAAGAAGSTRAAAVARAIWAVAAVGCSSSADTAVDTVADTAADTASDVAAVKDSTDALAADSSKDGLTACPGWQDQMGNRGLVCAKALTCHYDAAQYCCNHAFSADCSCEAGGKLGCNGPGAASRDWVCMDRANMCSDGCDLGFYKIPAGCKDCEYIKSGFNTDMNVLLAEHATCTSDDECGEVNLPACGSPSCATPVHLGHEASLTAGTPAILAKWCPMPDWPPQRSGSYCFVAVNCNSQGAKACIAGKCTWKPK